MKSAVRTEAALSRALVRTHSAPLLLIDIATPGVLDASPGISHLLGYTHRSLVRMQLAELFSPADMRRLAAWLKAPANRRHGVFNATFRQADGGSRTLNGMLSRIAGQPGRALWLADAAATHPGPATDNLHSVFAHLPGMTYQVLQSADGIVTLPYVSVQAAQLLGIQARSLRARPERFTDLILDADKPDYLARLAEADGVPMSFNWEGRIRVRAWKDVKWVNLRVRRRDTPDGTLWDGIMLNVTQSREAEAEIRRQRAQLAALTAHVESAKEQERLHLAREVHDDLGGNLTAIKIGLAGLQRRLPPDDAELHKRTAYLVDILDQTFEATRRIAASLRPPVLDFGIVSALEWQIERFSRTTGIACTFKLPADSVSLAADAAISVFRIVQEALTNVAKHARASRVTVTLGIDGTDLVASITDNGRGLPDSTARSGSAGFGVLGMSERAAGLGGTLAVAPATRRGTRVSLRVPLDAVQTKA
jgi:signal transduction histidine kinase